MFAILLGMRVECIICFKALDRSVALPCRHRFHIECVREWFRHKRNCPLCRASLRDREVRFITQVRQVQPLVQKEMAFGLLMLVRLLVVPAIMLRSSRSIAFSSALILRYFRTFEAGILKKMRIRPIQRGLFRMLFDGIVLGALVKSRST